MTDIDKSVFKQVIDSIGLKNIFTSMGIKVQDKGDRLQFSSPFREDKNPSMSCYKENNWCVDFAGEFRGSIFKLFREVTGKSLFSYYEVAKDFLMNKSFESLLKEEKKRDSFEGLKNVTVEYSGGYLDPVSSYPMAVEYCKRREITDEIIKEFNIQVAINTRINLTSYVDRLCIPIYYKGKLVSVEGRDLTGTSDRKVMYPKKGSVSTLFNLEKLDRKKPLIVVEGLMDLVKIWTHITKNVTTPFGVWLTDSQEELFNEFEQIILMPDSDAGGKTLIKNFDKFYNNEFEVAMTDDGKDPGDRSVEENWRVYHDRIKVTDYFLNEYEIFEPETCISTDEWEALL